MDVVARFVTCAVLAACLAAAGCSGEASTCARGTPVELPGAVCGLDLPGGDPAGADAPDRDGQGDVPPAEDVPSAADVPPDESPDLPADVPPADAAGEDTPVENLPVEDLPGADAPGDLPAQDAPVELPPCVPVQETCNDQDDDCNGVTDDGAADGDCDPDEICVAGRCVGDAVPVPAGPFWMGCNAFLDVGCKAQELPYRLVDVAKAYEIDVLEVTGDRYAAFLNAHGNVCDGVPF
ncbi:MAG: hypothetical protein FJ087_19845, partial [Deltaproteobacteria bacterium]|nr:hypothetical protein [Deltaproteobacteria bacterium]